MVGRVVAALDPTALLRDDPDVALHQHQVMGADPAHRARQHRENGLLCGTQGRYDGDRRVWETNIAPFGPILRRRSGGVVGEDDRPTMSSTNTDRPLFLDLVDQGSSGHGRRIAERDFDEVIFSAPFRRLARKTQVFPMLQDDSAHNRLSHSLECASVARSLGREAASHLPLPEGVVPGDVAATVATAALIHDIGNPAFGHAGESAICSAFHEGENWYEDLGLEVEILKELQSIDGNAIGLHMLLQGMTLSPTTILAATKRPWRVGVGEKFCVLSVDANNFADVASKGGVVRTGDDRWRRHPLSYLMEAADDICYVVMDAVDAVDLRVVTEDVCREHLEPIADEQGLPLEKLRDKTLAKLIKLAAIEFEANLNSILDGTVKTTLVKSLDGQLGGKFAQLKTFEQRDIYGHRPVVQLEVAAYEVMRALLESFCRAAASKEPSARERKLLDLMPHSVKKRVELADSAGGRVLEAVFYVSGMTDRYAYDLFQTLRGVRLPHMLP